MTGAEQVAVLDGALNAGYGVFDGLILAERSRAQAQSAAVGNDPAGLNNGGPGDGAGGGGPIIMAGSQGGVSGAQPGAAATAAGRTVSGTGAGGAGSDAETFPVPEDIPSGRDDDVVARQLREAAMREPDPELREKLWDEYRNYTGLRR
jgi:hypothetical protein